MRSAEVVDRELEPLARCSALRRNAELYGTCLHWTLVGGLGLQIAALLLLMAVPQEIVWVAWNVCFFAVAVPGMLAFVWYVLCQSSVQQVKGQVDRLRDGS